MRAATGKKLSPPGALRLAMEWRAPVEAAASLTLWPWLRSAARGDGHSVLVLPGLAAGDGSTRLLRSFLHAQGWDAHAWRQGLNLGPRPGVLETSLDHVQRLHAETGRRVSLVGWSLGGVYARELAKRLPEAVRQVVTLGSPVTGHVHASNARRLYEFVSGPRAYAPELMARLDEPVPVPCTSIYSRTDGIVAWQCSIQQPGGRTENIEVTASHVGMGLNPAAWYAVADRLAQGEGRWKPFHRRGWREWVFPDPQRA